MSSKPKASGQRGTSHQARSPRRAPRKPARALTAADVMNRAVVVVLLQMPVREAARLIHCARASEAAVVDAQGRCVGMLSADDLLRWIEAGCPEVVLSPAGACPYEVRGRLLTGRDAVICILEHESCPYQVSYPGVGGQHTDVCMRPAAADSPFGTIPRYLTTDVARVRPETPLPELVRQILDTRAEHLFVLDDGERPVGIVSATDVLKAVAHGPGRKSGPAGGR